MKPGLKVKSFLLCALCAVLLILSFPKFDIAFFAWFGFVPLFLALRNKSKVKAFFLAYLAGVIFWSGIIYWLVHVTLPGTIVLILYLALYFGIFGLIISTIDYRLSTIDPLFISSIWVILEYIRSHLFTGFPWALLGYSQYLNLPVIQISDITGAWGVSFLIIMVNLMVYSFIVDGSSFSVIRRYIIYILGIAAVFGYGYFRIHELRTMNNELKIKISVIQGNIPQELKWLPSASPYILKRYGRLTKEAAKENPDLIIWPEASSPGLFGQDQEIFAEFFSLSKEIKIPLLIGAVSRDKENYFNSALFIDNASIMASYDKLHLVPFGEYIPLKNMFPFLETVVPIGDITAGKEYTVFNLGLSGSQASLQAKFSVLICFEDLFPELSREFRKKGADFLVNITNDAWYKQTSAPYQHLQASVFRAVENRVFLARAANTGISGFIGPAGKITSIVADKSGRQIFSDGFKTQQIIAGGKGLSLYTRYGDAFIAICFLFLVYGIITRIKRRS